MKELIFDKGKHSHNYLLHDASISKNEKKTFLVVLLTSVMMVIEIIAGYVTGSMALLADGWHMASHAGALSISFIAYRLAKSNRMNEMFSFGAGKFIPLGGYTSAVALAIIAIIAIIMFITSIRRLVFPMPILFNQAIWVAAVGLIINVISAVILSDPHHKSHSHNHVHDHNLRSAYIHVMADALTSVFAIIALSVGMLFNIFWLDSVMGIIGSLVILKWAYNLCRDAGWELLDGHAKSLDRRQIKKLIENKNTSISDLHLWRIAPKAIACEMVVLSKSAKGMVFDFTTTKPNQPSFSL